MKNFVVNVLKAFSGVMSGPARAGVQTLAYFVGQIDLPDSDPKWGRVQEIVVETLENVAVASELEPGMQEAVKDAVLHRATVQLKELGLLKGG